MLHELISRLEKNAKLESPIDVERFEATLGQIAELNEPEAIPLLLCFLNDKCKYPETMFSIIHTIERFEDGVYARAIVQSLPTFSINSPYWASVVHFRIFNHQPTRLAYRSELARAAEESRTSARQFLTSMRGSEPQFVSACDDMLTVL